MSINGFILAELYAISVLVCLTLFRHLDERYEAWLKEHTKVDAVLYGCSFLSFVPGINLVVFAVGWLLVWLFDEPSSGEFP